MGTVNEMSDQYDVIAGWDWADQKHDLYVYDRTVNTKTHKIISSKPNALDEWISSLAGKKIAIAIEQKRGGVISMLLKYKNIDIYPVNPSALSSYRKAFSVSGSKNDEGDAWLLLDLLLKHYENFKKLESESEGVRKLNLLNELRRKSIDQRTALVNELTSLLKMYYPQAIDLVDRLDSDVASAMLIKWDCFDKIKAANENVVRKFFYKHNLRNEKCLQEKFELIRSGIPLTDDPAIIEPLVMRVKTIVVQIRALNESIATFDHKIEETFSKMEDRVIFESLPGAGKALAPRILCVYGSKKNNYEDALEVSTLSGVAPVTEKSGKKEWIHWRWNAPTFMRQTLVEFAGQSVKYSEWAKIYYNGMKAEGKGRNAILRALAFKWNRIIFRCWKNGTEYDEQAYIEALKKSGSWIGRELKNA